MAALVPSVLLYGQAASLLQELNDAQASGAIKDTQDLLIKLSDILTRFEETAGKPLLQYEPVDETEPPLSSKSNRFWRNAEIDITLLQQQVDILRAATVFSHNAITTEVMQAKNENARLANKLKTLQLYSNSSDANVITFGDSYKNFEFTDLTMVPIEERAALFNEGHVTLAQEGELVNLSGNSVVKVLDSSNGFLGNNQEVENPGSAPTDAETGASAYTFKSELRHYNKLDSIKDGEPDTWIEYERYHLTAAQKREALSYNFSYLSSNAAGVSEKVDWAVAPPDGILKFGLEFDLKKVKNLNSIEFTPYGLEQNSNYPVLVREVQTSSNGTDWTTVFPVDVWIGTDVNLKAARTAANVVAGKAVWAFAARSVRYVRIHVEQHHSVASNVGHSYWVNRRTGERAEGPNPPVENPQKYYRESAVGELLHRREYFPGKRWAIGIRDILLQQVEYAPRSVIVSKPLRVGGIIDRVILDRIDIEVPPEYPSDVSWVNFFITPDDGDNWYPISPVEDVFQDIPEQISFNDPLHASLRERNVLNYNTNRPVTSLRLKVELKRPLSANTTTPVLKSYVLKVRRR